VEVTTLSWWKDFDSIRAFAGDDVARAHYYPEDRRFLLTRPRNVHHFEVDSGAPPGARKSRKRR
jgi:hypothetical protein